MRKRGRKEDGAKRSDGSIPPTAITNVVSACSLFVGSLLSILHKVS